MSQIMFDDSLLVLVKTLSELADRDFIENGTALRDASGRLTFVANRPAHDEDERERFANTIIKELGPYAREDRPISFEDDIGAKAILSSSDCLPIKVGDVFLNLIDRRIVGSGWLDAPMIERVNPPRIVFSSLKGGVGRSTALAVAAADLARKNQNILVIDLDLEAPGLGDLLLKPEGAPKFGVIDYLVENGIGGVPSANLVDYIGTSTLTVAGGGRVDIFPALGSRSLANPENILPKLSRAMLEDVVGNSSVSVADQISAMISQATDREQYDVVFIDSRAGLSELAAPAVLGLGATVLLFGTAQKQTIEGYRALFAALRLLAQRDRVHHRDAEWRSMLRPVYAKASLDNDISKRFIDDMFELFSEYLYDAEGDTVDAPEALRYVRDDEDAPHWPLMIPFNQSFVDFDPTRVPGQLNQSFYKQTFGDFLSGLDRAIASQKTADGVSP